MTKRKGILFGLLLVLIFVSARLLHTPTRTQVVGNLAQDDLTEIMRLVRRDLRVQILPKVEWDNLVEPRYVINSVRNYQAQRILWAEVHEDGVVSVYAGVSKNAIRNEGYVWSLRKIPEWKITGSGYWSLSNSEIQIPPPP